MKTKIGKYIYFLTISILILYLFVQHYNNRELKNKVQIQSVGLAAIQDTVFVYKNKIGELTFKFNSVEVTSNNRKKALEEAGFEVKELRGRDIKWRGITNALKAQIIANGSGIIELHDTTYINNTDTIKWAEFKWNNRFLFLDGNITEKTMDFKYRYMTGIDLINEKKGKLNIVSVYLSDPNVVVTTANSITITNPTPWYKKPWIWGTAGLIGGYFLAK